MTYLFITARVRNTREGAIFTGVCLFTFGGGGIPSSRQGGTPSSRGWGIGTPSQVQVGISGLDGTVGRGGGKYPIPGPDGGGGNTLGYPPSRTGWGTPPHPGLDGVFPPPRRQEIEQHSEHLLRGRRYASCLPAGGLSCLSIYFANVTSSHLAPLVTDGNIDQKINTSGRTKCRWLDQRLPLIAISALEGNEHMLQKLYDKGSS